MLPILLFSHFVFLFFTRFTLWPEMVVYPYLLNHGFLLYRDIINPYPPLLLYKLSFFANIAGYQPLPYQILAWSIILMTDILIFKLAKILTGKTSSAVLATVFFMILSIPLGVNGLWFDLVQTPLVLISVFFFGRFMERKSDYKSLIISSLALSIAFFIKQQALWLVIWFLANMLFYSRGNLKKIDKPVFILVAPLAVGIFIEALIFLPQNLLNDFVFWTIALPFFKASSMPGYVLLPTLRQLLVVAGLFVLLAPVILKRDRVGNFYLLSAAVLVLFAYPRFDYFHLIPALSVLALSAATALDDFKKSKRIVLLLSLLALLLLSAATARYLQRNWTREVRFFEKDVYQAAGILSKINTKDKPVFLQNVSGQILPLSQTLPTKPWADSFPWYLESPSLQTNIVAGVLNEKPDFVLYKPYSGDGAYELSSYRPRKIADFIDGSYAQLRDIPGGLILKMRLFK